jgi:hypothetical protein
VHLATTGFCDVLTQARPVDAALEMAVRAEQPELVIHRLFGQLLVELITPQREPLIRATAIHMIELQVPQIAMLTPTRASATAPIFA